MSNGVLIIVLVIAAVAFVFLGYAVHCALNKYCYIPHAQRFCTKKGLKPLSWICGPAIDKKSGRKTEFSIVELDCVDNSGQKHFVRLLVRFRGVETVLKVEPPYDLMPTPTKISGAA